MTLPSRKCIKLVATSFCKDVCYIPFSPTFPSISLSEFCRWTLQGSVALHHLYFMVYIAVSYFKQCVFLAISLILDLSLFSFPMQPHVYYQIFASFFCSTTNWRWHQRMQVKICQSWTTSCASGRIQSYLS